MKSAEIRHAFLDYFAVKGHAVVATSPLIPANDPTLLFTNAGMVQFKEVFLGQEKRDYSRATSAQRCVRAGGKHNDLENVGYTARHHTFFEMLGNFSFGDYFKRDAIFFAWEFLTQILKLPTEKLWITVFEKDDEAANIWLNEVKINPHQFSRCGEKDNFWAMGDTGPCGPCTEIFYDHGPAVAGGPPGSPEADGDRYIEIWNLVFMQYNRTQDGQLHPLPKPSVDTGMGLERLAAVLQGVHNNYDIDLFQNLIKKAAALTHTVDLKNTSLRVIADHIRSTSFLITDGVRPSNEGRGYVLRRIIRRAIRHGNKLGTQQPFFHQLVAPLVAEMGEAYPELAKAQAIVEQVLLQEEEQFAKTINQGLKMVEQAIHDSKNGVIAGRDVFRLYDTYGFPVDLTADIARERGLTLNMTEFETEMAAQRKQSQEASRFAVNYDEALRVAENTAFTGYEGLHTQSHITALFKAGIPTTQLTTDDKGIIVLAATPFYAEAGGQVGDTGVLENSQGGVFVVEDTRRQGDTYLHHGYVKQGYFSVNETVDAQVDGTKRRNTALNHSATHLLHAALRKVLGEHVIQKGSLVAPDRLRFDFAHLKAITPAELRAIERLVNDQIRANVDVKTKITDMKQAIASGAMALFGEKYGENVRVLSMGRDNFSVELCGGTHVSRTGDIGIFKIISETGIAAGVRRIEAVTGQGALAWIESLENTLSEVAENIKADKSAVVEKLKQLLARNKALEKSLEQSQAKAASAAGKDLVGSAIEVNGIKVLAASLASVDIKALRDTMDQLKNKLDRAVIVLAAVQGEKITLLSGVTPNCSDQFHAGELVNYVSQQVGGKGGGRADLAQAGGDNPAQLSQALASVVPWVEQRVSEKRPAVG